MYDIPGQEHPLARWRRTVVRKMLDYPTDPISTGVVAVGLFMVIATLSSGSPLHLVAATLLVVAFGAVSFAVARSRFVMRAGHVATGAMIATLTLSILAFAPYPVWWLSFIALSSLACAVSVYFWGVRAGLVWYAVVAAVALVSVLPGLLARNETIIEQLIAGECLLLLIQTGILLFMPQQFEGRTRQSALRKQSDELDNLTLQISATADGLGRASSAIHMVTSQQGSGAEQQAAAITEAVTMLNEFLALADEVRDQAQGVADLSTQTATVSTSGQQAIRKTIDAITQIRDQVTVIAHNIASLAQQMQRIDEIIRSVSEIATQSNLLALNASIEAARAGVHGQGFAVVAGEVRSLAQQSKAAAAQVQGILGQIQEAMKQTVQATQTGDKQVDEGMALSRQAGDVITQLATRVDDSAEAVHSILDAIDQQATGLEQITLSMRNIHEVTQQNLASTHTANTVVENLNRLSEELLAAIARSTGANDGAPPA